MTDTFLFEIVTPGAAVLSQPAELVIIPGGDGNFGVLPGHAPLLSDIRPGTIEIRERSLKIIAQYFVEGGFAEVTPERCTVLAEEIISVSDITRDEAEERLKKAHDALMIAEAFSVRLSAEQDLRAAKARLEALDTYERSFGRNL